MQEYKISGLSCANCAREIEEGIQKLNHGENAKVLFNSGKLRISKKIDLSAVKEILAKDGASLIEGDTSDDHDHDHDHGNIKLLLIGSSVLFFIALMVNIYVSTNIAIPIYLLAMILSGYQTFVKGLKNLIKLKFNIETLMTIALLGAVLIGEWKEATIVAILFGLNEYLEGLGMNKARKSMEKLLQVAPKNATLMDKGKQTTVSIDSLNAGDVVLVRSGEKIPSDGKVVSGRSSVNEAAITGESLPIEKEIEDTVFGGSINNEGVLEIEIVKAYKDSSLAKILHLVEEAQETKTPTELFINKFARYYTPLIMLISGLVMVVPPVLLNGEWGAWFYQGLAVLIVGCPCALILSSPIAIVSGITRNARNGVLVKGGIFLEQLGKIDALAFDKTGTLTKGEPYVEELVSYDKQFLSIASAIEKSSSHPLAKAIMTKVDDFSVGMTETEEIETVSGKGIIATIAGKSYFLGSEKVIDHIHNVPDDVQQDLDAFKQNGLTIVLVADETQVLGMFGIADEVRTESKNVVDAIHSQGLKNTIMLTGDHEQTAQKVAQQVGVSHYFAGLLPEEKVEKIKQYKQQGTIAMVGDGINDAPALATADLGIAMGKGTDSAIETADVVLMQDHLGKLPDAISISKKVNRTVRLNITLALCLKAFALLLTIPGLLTLWIAILADMGATILVTLISLTILFENKNKHKPSTESRSVDNKVQPSE